ncbi:MAG TPA: DNA alkylation repair protein [Candidatus Angelobacter sp.]
MNSKKSKKLDYRDAARELRRHGNAARAAFSVGYFKDTAGDMFLGVAVPAMRRLASEFRGVPMTQMRRLMQSSIHEERMLAIEILRLKFQKGSPQQQKEIFHFYMKNRRCIRSWDGVDGSAPYIVGCYLLRRDKKVLYELARSDRLWDRRIAVVATLWFIRNGHTRDTLKIARMLLNDKEDLIHKATGWMLREVGKQKLAELKKFLRQHSKTMPRTMLRYAIERFPEAERKRYLAR